MGISMSGMSGLGLSASAIGRADDEERRRRLESVIATLKSKPGRVSEEGIMAMCKKEGLEVVREARGSETLLTLLIGNDAMLDIPIKNGEIESTSLSLASDREDLKFGDTASKILLRDLQPPPGIPRINLTLERFSNNLDKLMRMDKLSASGVNCFQAVFGVYTSLKKLFEHEKKMAMAVYDANTPNASIKAEREVLCKKSGRPRINGGNFLGLALEYWMDRRHLITPPKSKPSDKSLGKMAVDSGNATDGEDDGEESNKIYSMLIECESSPSSLYTPIRVSEDWIAPEIEKAAEAADAESLIFGRPSLAWRDPEPTYLPSAPTGADAMDLDAQPGRLPNIRFIAKFNPPLVVPLSVAVAIHQSVEAQIPNDAIRPTTFVGLALRPGEADPGATGLAGESTQELRSETTVLSLSQDGNEEDKQHSNSLYIPRTEYARVIDVLPFQHPRQLIDILPTLRQYAYLTSLLQHTFLPAPQTSTSSLQPGAATSASPFSALQTSTETDSTSRSLQLDFTLTYAQPTPRLSMHLPHPNSSTIAGPSFANNLSDFNINDALSDLWNTYEDITTTHSPQPPISLTIDVLPNADLVLSEQNIVPLPKDEIAPQQGEHDKLRENEVEASRKRVERIGRALDVCGDLGVWAEWVLREVRKDG
jgi:hypothetical protein